MMKGKAFALMLFVSFCSSAGSYSKSDIVGLWECKFTFPLVGDKILEQKFKFNNDGSFSSFGKFTYFTQTPRDAFYSFDTDGKWEYIRGEMFLKYEPFDIKASDDYSEKWLEDIKNIYISKSFKGTRQISLFVEKVEQQTMILGDEYDSWKCKSKEWFR